MTPEDELLEQIQKAHAAHLRLTESFVALVDAVRDVVDQLNRALEDQRRA